MLGRVCRVGEGDSKMTKHDIEAALAEVKRFEERASEMLRLMQEYEAETGIGSGLKTAL